MPYIIRKLPNSKLYRVRLKDTGQVLSKATTLENAHKQIALLRMKDAEKGGGVGEEALQIVGLEKSKRKGKKLVAIFNDGQRIDFGSDVSQTYSEGAPKEKMQNYWKRHLANPTERQRIENLEPSAALLSAYILWLTPSLDENVKKLNELLRSRTHHAVKVGEGIQSVLFSKEHNSQAQADAWLRKKGLKIDKSTPNFDSPLYFRYRQHDPDEERYQYRMKLVDPKKMIYFVYEYE